MKVLPVILIALLALSAGMQIGRLLTLWQLGVEKRDDRHDQRRDGDD